MRDFLILTTFFLSVAALLGLQLYKGGLKKKCVWNAPHTNLTHIEFKEYINNESMFTSFEAKMFLLRNYCKIPKYEQCFLHLN
jgi:hypothetical protein